PFVEPAAEAPIAAEAAPFAEIEPLPAEVDGRARAGAARTTDLLRRFRPGQNIDAELDAFEAEQEQAEAAVAAQAAHLSEAQIVEPEPVAAEAPMEHVAEELPAVAPEPEP